MHDMMGCPSPLARQRTSAPSFTPSMPTTTVSGDSVSSAASPSVVRQILEYARLSSDLGSKHVVFASEPFQLHSLVSDLLDMYGVVHRLPASRMLSPVVSVWLALSALLLALPGAPGSQIV